ncbi:Protein kinase domain [Carpediemonas membranifera]|uniref:Protein kinase domain n=1 Tax=Carpediemonas membranifera TaxID=201153 RepID=A0A8J6EB56_9EUKA|nr:Protein kinase domain [Carpediemonas membranifera]|eukprot:KAG9396310.1 Protein kinase domain [Carpediemonas membranifera]
MAPILFRDLASILLFLLSERIDPEHFVVELTDPPVTVKKIGDRLTSSSSDTWVNLALVAWNKRYESSRSILQTATDARDLVDQSEDRGCCCATAFTYGKSYVVSATIFGSVCVWSTDTGVLIHHMEFPTTIYRAALSPDGRMVAFGTFANHVHLWRLGEDGMASEENVLVGHEEPVARLAFSPDGSTLVASAGTVIIIWDVLTLRLVARIPDAARKSVTALVFTPDGLLITGGDDGTVSVLDVPTSACIKTMKHGSGRLSEVAVSPDGRTIATSSGSSVKLWTLESGQEIGAMDEHAGTVLSLVFSPDGSTVLSCVEEGLLKEWDVTTKHLIHTFEDQLDCSSLLFSPDGSTLAAGKSDGSVTLLPVDPRQSVHATLIRLAVNPSTEVDLSIGGTIGDLAWAILAFLVHGLPDSFTMQLTQPVAVVRTDAYGTLMTCSDDVELGRVVDWFNWCYGDMLALKFCSHPVPSNKNVSLRCSRLSILRQVLAHAASTDTPWSTFTAVLANPRATVTIEAGQFTADRQIAQVDAVVSQSNCDLLRTQLSQSTRATNSISRRLADCEAINSKQDETIADLKATLVMLCIMPPASHFRALSHAVGASSMLEGHPLLFTTLQPPQVKPEVASPEHLAEKLAMARNRPTRRASVYDRVIAQAEAGVKALRTWLADVAARHDHATRIIELVEAFEANASIPPDEELARLLIAADGETDAFPLLKLDLQARYSTLRDFLDPVVAETRQKAVNCKNTGGICLSETEMLSRLEGLLLEAKSHLVAFQEASAQLNKFHNLGDFYHLKSKAAELEMKAKFYDFQGKTAKAKDTRSSLSKTRAIIGQMNAVRASCSPHLVRLCPELKALTTPPVSLFTELREMGLAHFMDLPEMRADLSLSGFTVESTVRENRALCQILTRDGQIYFAKTFRLDTEHGRKLCDREAGILSRLAHSPTVPKLHFVLVDLSDPERKTGTIVMEHLESHLRDAPVDSPESLRRLLHSLLTAIHDLHSAGICHRDLKPENVMLREGHPVLVDFETASNMDAVNATATATGFNIGTLAYSSPEENAARLARVKMTHRESEATDVYHAGLTMLAVMASDYATFCLALLSHSNNKDLADASTVDDDALCDALMKTVTVPDALRDVLSGMLATHPEARWSVRRALADGLFAASANELDPEVDLNAASNRFASAHAFVDDIDRARLQMFHDDPIDIKLGASIETNLTNLGACAEDLLSCPATLAGRDSAKALPDLVAVLPDATVTQAVGDMTFTVPIFREGTLVFTPDALDMPLDDLRPVLLGLGRVLQLMLLDCITLPADMVSDAWLVALAGVRINLRALMPIVDHALQTSLGDASKVCPLEGFEGNLKAYGDEVRRRFAERMQIIRNGMAAKTRFSAKVLALTPAQLRALLVRPNPLSVDAVLAPLRFPRGGQRVQDALRAVLEDDEARRRFAFHMFGGQLPQPDSVSVTLHDHHRVYADCAGGARLPRLEDAGQMRQAVLDSAPATAAAAADFYVIPRHQHAFSRAEIRTLVEQNDILQTCRLVTLGGGAAVDVPVIRRCPACGALASREGDLNSCKMSRCPCGQDFCHKCLLCVANQEEHMAHYGGECEMAPRQTVDIPGDVEMRRNIACTQCGRKMVIGANRKQVSCRKCGKTMNVADCE